VPHRTDHSEAIRRSGHVQVREQRVIPKTVFQQAMEEAMKTLVGR
jgi:hypothetical protein